MSCQLITWILDFELTIMSLIKIILTMQRQDGILGKIDRDALSRCQKVYFFLKDVDHFPFCFRNLTATVANRTLASMEPAETVFLVTTVSATLDTLESTVKVGCPVQCI